MKLDLADVIFVLVVLVVIGTVIWVGLTGNENEREACRKVASVTEGRLIEDRPCIILLPNGRILKP